MTETAIKTVTFTETVLLRPKMYTITGTLGEIVCFLNGYYSGIARSHSCAPDVQEWQQFRRFLSRHFLVDSAYIFHRMMECYPENEKAIEAMSELLVKFHEASLRSNDEQIYPDF